MRTSADNGVAMLEFVLMLPFIWIVLVLTFDFGQAFLERQRTLVAVRELAFRHTAEVAERGDTSVDASWHAVERDTLDAKRLEGEAFLDRRGDGTCSRRSGDAVDEGAVGRSLGKLGAALGRLSSAHVYEVSARGPRVAGRLLPSAVHERCFVVDGSPWTIHETGTPWTWLQRLGGLLGTFISRML